MPIQPTSSGFRVSYSRGKCLLFTLLAVPFTVLMLLAGLNTITPFLADTPLHWLVIERQPAIVYSMAMIAAAVLGCYLVLWSTSKVLGDPAAIEVDSNGVTSHTIIGQRSAAWADVSSASLFRSTLFLAPNPGSDAPTVPLGLFLTGVSVEELRAELLRYRPDLFSGTSS